MSFFEKISKILIFLEELYKSREIPDIIYLRHLSKNPKNGLDGGLLAMQRRLQDFLGGGASPAT